MEEEGNGQMEKLNRLNYLLDERFDLIQKVDYWTGDENEEKRMHKEIDRLTKEINKIRKWIGELIK